MKDIDFDELDKAVNSLMGGIKDQSDQPAPKTLTISTTLKEDEQPEYTKLEQVAQKIGSETIGAPLERTAILSGADNDFTTTVDLSSAEVPLAPSPSSVVAPSVSPTEPVSIPTPPVPEASVPKATAPSRRPSGRFMDVMHHSSDMKTPTTAPVSREAATIVPPPRSVDSSAPTSIPTSVSKTPQAEESPAEAQLPDTPEIASSEPLSSPFLPDAKVEKRPLGGLSAPENIDSLDQHGASPQERQQDTQLAPTSSATIEPELPEELSDNLLAIETNSVAEAPLEGTPLDTPVTFGEVPAATEEKQPEPLGPSSIAQQYKELPTTGDQSNGAIFDVNDYHKQPIHPAKSGRSWLWIILIIIIVVVCGAGAAAFYLLSAQ